MKVRIWATGLAVGERREGSRFITDHPLSAAV